MTDLPMRSHSAAELPRDHRRDAHGELLTFGCGLIGRERRGDALTNAECELLVSLAPDSIPEARKSLHQF